MINTGMAATNQMVMVRGIIPYCWAGVRAGVVFGVSLTIAAVRSAWPGCATESGPSSVVLRGVSWVAPVLRGGKSPRAGPASPADGQGAGHGLPRRALRTGFPHTLRADRGHHPF